MIFPFSSKSKELYNLIIPDLASVESVAGKVTSQAP